jgi:hypothetical protein
VLYYFGILALQETTDVRIQHVEFHWPFSAESKRSYSRSTSSRCRLRSA